MLGTAGLPHILMRFFTVPDAKAARKSVLWAMGLIGAFYLMTTALGFGARAFLGQGGVEAAGKGGNLAAPNLAQELGGGAGTAGGDIFLAVDRRGRVRDDPRRGRGPRDLGVGRGRARRLVERDPQGQGLRAGGGLGRPHRRLAVGAIAIAIALIGGAGLNVAFMVGLAFAVAASATFPALLLALTWRRFNTTGAVTGVLFGVVSAIGLIIMSPTVWPGPDSEGSPFGLDEPGDHLDPARVHRLLARARC